MSTGTYQRGGQRNGQQQHNPELITEPGNGDMVNYAEQQSRGEIDTQIATAKRFPRSIKQFKERALSYATLDEETASSCFYKLPARRGGNDKPIEGPSVRLAEIVAASYGNLRVQVAVVNDDGQTITAEGRCWDLENNVAISVPVQRRVVDKNGNRYSADMINTTANAACSIALRNAMFRVVPMALVKPVYDAARQVAIGSADTLVERRAKLVDYFKKMGVKLDQILAAVEKPSIEDITVDDLLTLKGMATAIKDGETTIDEAFPAPAKDKPQSEPVTTPADTSKKQKPKAESVREKLLTRVATAVDVSQLELIMHDADQAVGAGDLTEAEQLDINAKCGTRVHSFQ